MYRNCIKTIYNDVLKEMKANEENYDIQYNFCNLCNLENKSHNHAPNMLLMKGISSVVGGE